jgi:hypothetical protein
MDFLKKFFENDKTVVGLCDLKRRQAVNSFNFGRLQSFNRPFQPNEIPGGLVYAKF